MKIFYWRGFRVGVRVGRGFCFRINLGVLQHPHPMLVWACVGNFFLPIKSLRNNILLFLLGYIVLDETEVKTKAVTQMVSAIEICKNNPVYSIKIPNFETPGNKVLSLCEAVLQVSSKQEFKVLSEFTASKIFDIIKKCDLTELKEQEELLSSIHKFILDSDSWCDFIKANVAITVDLKTVSLFLFPVIQNYITQFLKEVNHRQDQSNQKILYLKLTQEEEKVIYYVAGYVVFALRNKYKILLKSKKMDIAVAALQFLDSLKVVGDTPFKVDDFESYIQQWVDHINRGGLIKVNKEMFYFVSKIEMEVRSVLNISLDKSYHREDLREVLLYTLYSDESVSMAWESLSRNIPNESLQEILKKQVIMKWIDIRARSFVKTYIQILKRISTKSKSQKLFKKAEPAMRKKLT